MNNGRLIVDDLVGSDNDIIVELSRHFSGDAEEFHPNIKLGRTVTAAIRTHHLLTNIHERSLYLHHK
jgi:hypothetical protein